MTNTELLRIAKRTSCNCVNCKCTVKSRSGARVFGNEPYLCKVDADGKTYCSSCAIKLGIVPVEIPEWKEKGRLTEVSEKTAALPGIPEGKLFDCYETGTHNKRHARRIDGSSVFVYAYKRSRRGWELSNESFLRRYDFSTVSEGISEEEKWHRRIRTAIKRLEASGLWNDLLLKLKNLDTMTLEDKRAIYNIRWDAHTNPNSDGTEYDEYVKKYPFAFYHTKGKTSVDTFYIWEMSNVILKSMYFGKYANASCKENIRNAIKDKKDISVSERVQYDVSFNYDASKNAAWYSEEYRGCGNGHYYIALDENMAWFCEDD